MTVATPRRDAADQPWGIAVRRRGGAGWRGGAPRPCAAFGAPRSDRPLQGGGEGGDVARQHCQCGLVRLQPLLRPPGGQAARRAGLRAPQRVAYPSVCGRTAASQPESEPGGQAARPSPQVERKRRTGALQSSPAAPAPAHRVCPSSSAMNPCNGPTFLCPQRRTGFAGAATPGNAPQRIGCVPEKAQKALRLTLTHGEAAPERRRAPPWSGSLGVPR